MGFTLMSAVILQGWVNMWKIKVLLSNYSTLENAVVCVIEMLLSEYQAQNKLKRQIKLIKKVKVKDHGCQLNPLRGELVFL